MLEIAGGIIIAWVIIGVLKYLWTEHTERMAAVVWYTGVTVGGTLAVLVLVTVIWVAFFRS